MKEWITVVLFAIAAGSAGCLEADPSGDQPLDVGEGSEGHCDEGTCQYECVRLGFDEGECLENGLCDCTSTTSYTPPGHDTDGDTDDPDIDDSCASTTAVVSEGWGNACSTSDNTYPGDHNPACAPGARCITMSSDTGGWCAPECCDLGETDATYCGDITSGTEGCFVMSSYDTDEGPFYCAILCESGGDCPSGTECETVGYYEDGTEAKICSGYHDTDLDTDTGTEAETDSGGGASILVVVDNGESEATVALDGLETVSLTDNWGDAHEVVLLDRILEAAGIPAGDIDGYVLDFLSSDASGGLDPEDSGSCAEIVPYDAEHAAEGGVEPDSRNLRWTAELDLPECMHLADLAVLYAHIP